VGGRGIVKCPLVRFIAVLGLPVILLFAGAIYFSAKPKNDDARLAAALARAEKMGSQTFDADDRVDTIVVRDLIGAKTLSDEQTTMLISAAGRRYLRRKQALAAAQEALAEHRGDAATVAGLQGEVDTARRICDFAESMGHSRELLATASLESQWDRIL